ncbi:MAG: hypothetical protein JWL98_669 [Xanthomonadaceae bacterium]|nr:hypothetical protein [Xanthomonadaceae bacterium]
MKGNYASALLAAGLFLGVANIASAAGSVVDYIEPRNQANPAPTMALNRFQRFTIQPIAMDAPYAGQGSNEDAKKSIQANLDLRAQPLLAQWNAMPAGAAPRTLSIAPTIRHIKFISGGARFWAGAFAGGSAVLMTMRLTDAATGEVIAEPEFYQHANKRGAAWSMGATDRAMLIRVASMAATYLHDNYTARRGWIDERCERRAVLIVAAYGSRMRHCRGRTAP